MNRLRNPFLGLLMLALGACQSGRSPLPAPTLQSTPIVLHIMMTPAVRPAIAALQACARANPGIAILIEEIPPQAINLHNTDLSLQLGALPQDDAILVPLAQEEILVVVHPGIPLQILPTTKLTALYHGEVQAWDDLLIGHDLPDNDISLWGYPQRDPLRQIFEAAVLGQDNDQTPGTFLAPDPGAMRQAIASTPGAVGYLPRAWLDDSISIVRLARPIQDKLRLPLLAAAPQPLQRATNTMLGCLQGPIGQESLAAHYQIWESP